MIRFITGGARSGKSRHAEQLAVQSGLEVIYLATAQARDAEMQVRVEQHQAQRPAHWRTLEAPLALAEQIAQQQAPERCLLIDCLTLWVTNQLLAEADLAAERERLVASLKAARGEIILVSNETGMGVVPLGELTRRFVDESGWLHQQVAASADQVVWMVAGIPVPIKGASA